MKDYERVEGGVKKTFSWGYSICYGNFEDCFTKAELLEVLKDYTTMIDNEIIDPKTDETYKKIKEKMKAKIKA